jgi:emp24/gp25L/p24 family/GOLD.
MSGSHLMSINSSRPMTSSHPRRPISFLTSIIVILLVLLQPLPTHAIKFTLQSYRYPPPKCIWNSAHNNALVIVTANVGPGDKQRVDIEIVDSSPQQNVYLSKKGIKAETRLAITTHAEGQVGVCLKNYMDHGALDCYPNCADLVLSCCLNCCLDFL